MNPQVFAYAQIDDDDARHDVYSEIKKGKSRFGMWDQDGSLIDTYYGANIALLRIKEGDWIVHVNSPEYGSCVAVRAVGSYQFDDGIPVEYGGRDFNNFIPVNPESVIEFSRDDPNVLPSVNLAPRKRIQRVLAVDDFLQSLENLRTQRFTEYEEGIKGTAHVKSKIRTEIYPQITSIIQEMNRGKDFEKYLHKIFLSMPNIRDVQKNGFGWKSDQGADLIVEFENPIAGVNLTTKLIIQAKSYVGSHYDLNAVDQIREGIDAFKADGGLLITTAESTEELEDKLRKTSEEIGKTIDLMAGAAVARFVLSHAPELLLG